MKQFTHSNKGFSLIEMLVATGVGLTILFVFTTVLLNQQKEIRRLAVKSEVLDLARSLRTALSKGNTCLNNFGAGTHNFTAVPTSGTTPLHSPIITPTVIRDGNTGTSPELFRTGSIVPGIPGLTVQSMELTNWMSPGTDRFKADLVIKFDPSFGPIAPITVKQLRFKTNPADPIGAKTITGCEAPAFGGGGIFSPWAGQTITCHWAGGGGSRFTDVNYSAEISDEGKVARLCISGEQDSIPFTLCSNVTDTVSDGITCYGGG